VDDLTAERYGKGTDVAWRNPAGPVDGPTSWQMERERMERVLVEAEELERRDRGAA
jgi:hypothetical protein